MAKQWEITGRLGELQLEWLKRTYPPELLEEGLRRLPKKGYPLNVAKVLHYKHGGPPMPSPQALLAADPVSQAEAERVKNEALARLRALRAQLAGGG